MSGGSKTQTTTQQTVIPEEVKPLLSQYLAEAGRLGSGSSSKAMQANNAAQQGLMQTASGSMLNGNPYFDKNVNKAMGDIMRNYQEAIAPGTNANFARAGAFGGSAWQQANERNQRGLGEALGNTANSMYSGNYGQERQNQMQAFGMLPGVGSANMGLLGQAVGVGMGGAGSTSTEANPNYLSPFQRVLGLGALFS